MKAEGFPYWKTSKSSADSWLEKCETEIKRAGGSVAASGFINSAISGSAYMIEFDLDSNRFRLVERVLDSRSGDSKAAKVQAATTMYHDLKGRMISARRKGARTVFLAELVLPSGQTVGEMDQGAFADMVTGGNSGPFLIEG